MKKMLARVLAILMVFNLGVIPTAYATPQQYPDPTVVDTTASQATFGYYSMTAGTMYYAVTSPELSAPTAAEVKAMALSGTATPVMAAGGSVTVSAAAQGSFSVANLKGDTYKLFTTLETNGVLTAVTMKEFTPLYFEWAPSVTRITADGFDITAKLNASGYVYYGIYKDATGVTAADVLMDAENSNKVRTGFVEMSNGIQESILMYDLYANAPYDIVLVRKDMYGNYSQTPTVLNDVKTAGNRLIGASFTKGEIEFNNDDRIYLYFSETIESAGTIGNYLIQFVDETNTTNTGYTLVNDGQYPDFSVVGFNGNQVELALDPNVYTTGKLTPDNFILGHMQVTLVTSGAGIMPSVVESDSTIGLQITEAMMTGNNNKPMMIQTTYHALPDEGADSDRIEVILDTPMTSSPAAINFDIAFGLQNMTELHLIPETDFTFVEKDDVSFYLSLTSEGAIKVDAANLPTTYYKVNYSTSPPTGFNLHIPTVIGMRDSSVRHLTGMAVFGIPVPGFSPTVYEYTMSLPYAMLQAYNSTPAAGLHATPALWGSRLFMMSPTMNQIYVEVQAEDGSMATYSVTIVPDELTLGGLAINNVKFPNFDPAASSYTYQTTTVFTATPTLTVIHASNTTKTVTSVLSAPNTYVFTIVLTKDGSSRTFTVTVIGGASSNSGSDDRGDIYPGTGTGGTTPIPGGGTFPTPEDIAKFLDPAKEITNFVLPPDLMNQTNLDFSLNFVKDAINSVLTEQQAINTLNNMDSLMKQVNTNIGTRPDEVAQVTQLMTNLTTGTEKKMALITNPEQQLAVLDKMMVEVQQFKLKVAAPTPDLDKSVQELVQKTANNFGTLKITAPVTAEPVKLDTANLTALIAKQTEAITKLNELQKTYFENGIAKPIKQELRIVAETPTGLGALKIELAPDQIGTLKDAKVESLTVSNVNAEIKVPVINFGGTNAVQLVIEKMPQPAVAPQPGEPTLVYDMALMVNNEKQEKFSKPITLAFSLVTFNLDKESPNELAIFKKNEATGVWEPVGGIVDPEGAKIFVTRDNLSQYTVLKSKKSFSDADTSWAKAEINAMLNKGIIADSGKFNPQSALTRGEFAQWIAKAYGLKVSSASLPFKDVAKGGDEYAAIAAVYEQGLLSGKSKNSFDPKGAVTQNEMAAALGKLLVSFDNKAKSGKVTSKYLSQLKTTQVASWAEDDMALLMELGLNTSGGSGKDVVTKEAAAAAFMKFYRS